MNVITSIKTLWSSFDKWVKFIHVSWITIVVLNLISMFFENGSQWEAIIHSVMIVVIALEFFFVYKELEFLKTKEKFRQL